jgi:hypothetical protein
MVRRECAGNAWYSKFGAGSRNKDMRDGMRGRARNKCGGIQRGEVTITS